MHDMIFECNLRYERRYDSINVLALDQDDYGSILLENGAVLRINVKGVPIGLELNRVSELINYEIERESDIKWIFVIIKVTESEMAFKVEIQLSHKNYLVYFTEPKQEGVVIKEVVLASKPYERGPPNERDLE